MTAFPLPYAQSRLERRIGSGARADRGTVEAVGRARVTGGVAATFAIVVLALAIGRPAELPAQTALSVLERASERYQALAAFCADFRQEIDVTLLREVKRSRGELCQARPDRFEMLFSDPAGDRVVADGTHLWVYFRSVDDGQVMRTDLADGQGRFDLHREFLSDPGLRYEAELVGRETVDGRDTFVLALSPRVPSPYRNARIWVDASDSLIRRLVIQEDESVRTLDLTNIRTNPSLEADRFRFVPPSGVQVIPNEE